jgi:hypothetical protein
MGTKKPLFIKKMTTFAAVTKVFLLLRREGMPKSTFTHL